MRGTTVAKYSGWRPRSLRLSKGSSEAESPGRRQKRSRLGNAQDRAIYTSAKGYKNSKYPVLCARADQLNNRKSK